MSEGMSTEIIIGIGAGVGFILFFLLLLAILLFYRKRKLRSRREQSFKVEAGSKDTVGVLNKPHGQKKIAQGAQEKEKLLDGDVSKLCESMGNNQENQDEDNKRFSSPVWIQEIQNNKIFVRQRSMNLNHNVDARRSLTKKELNAILDDDKELNPLLDDVKELNPLQDDDKELNPLQDNDKELNPTLDDDKELNPLLDDVKELNPILVDNKELNNKLDYDEAPSIDDENDFAFKEKAGNSLILEEVLVGNKTQSRSTDTKGAEPLFSRVNNAEGTKPLSAESIEGKAKENEALSILLRSNDSEPTEPMSAAECINGESEGSQPHSWRGNVGETEGIIPTEVVEETAENSLLITETPRRPSVIHPVRLIKMQQLDFTKAAEVAENAD